MLFQWKGIFVASSVEFGEVNTTISTVSKLLLKQKSIPIFFTEKRKAFHWLGAEFISASQPYIDKHLVLNKQHN